jgi:hypothetical protein
MTLDPYIYLQAEEQEVKRLLARISGERWIERMSFEGRLKSIQAELAEMTPTNIHCSEKLMEEKSELGN